MGQRDRYSVPHFLIWDNEPVPKDHPRTIFLIFLLTLFLMTHRIEIIKIFSIFNNNSEKYKLFSKRFLMFNNVLCTKLIRLIEAYRTPHGKRASWSYNQPCTILITLATKFAKTPKILDGSDFYQSYSRKQRQ